MDNIIELTTMTNMLMAEATTRAMAEGKPFRLVTGMNPQGEQWVKWKVGEGMWTPPMYAVPQIPPTQIGDFVMTVK